MSSEPPPSEGSPEAPAASSSTSPPKDATGSGAPEMNTLWVGNLPSHVGEGDVMALFAPHGALDCALARAGPRSYAFVLFRSPAEARAAVEATRGAKVKGASIRTEFARPARAVRNLWVGGISPSVSKEEVEEEFQKFGKIEGLSFSQDQTSAYIDFEKLEDAISAHRSLNGRSLGGSELCVDFQRSKGRAEWSDASNFSGRVSGSLVEKRGPGTVKQSSAIRGSYMYSDGRHGSGLGSATLQGYDPPVGGRSRFSGYVGGTPGGVLRSPEYFDPRDTKRVRLDAGVDYDARASSTTIYSSGLRHQDRSERSEGSSIPIIRVKGAVHQLSYLEHFWRGDIAKGGSPVCRARCLPIGKGIDIALSDVINCSARTGLDMLAKHYADATGFDIVFFLPDSEEDFISYTEFLRYLGSKSRAGVVKVAGTTLFLVPPSDFLTNVLQVDGPERLYGVVLHIPQVSAAATLRPLTGPEQQPQPYYDERGSLQRKYNAISPTDNGFPDADYRVSSREDSIHHLGQLHQVNEGQAVQAAMASFPTNQTVGPRLQSSLTPDIMATLAKLMPSVQPAMNSADRHASSQMHDSSSLSKVWKPENHHQPGQQFPRQTSGAHLTSYGNMVGAQEHTAYNPEVTLNLPPPPPVPTVAHGSALLASQGGHILPTQPNQHQYQPEHYYVPQTHYDHSNIQASNIPAPSVLQVNPRPSTSNNQMGNMVQLQNTIPLNVNRGSQDFSSQGQQQQQNYLPSSSQASEEADKSKRYQATLQLAQSLLLQIKKGGTGNQP